MTCSPPKEVRVGVASISEIYGCGSVFEGFAIDELEVAYNYPGEAEYVAGCIACEQAEREQPTTQLRPETSGSFRSLRLDSPTTPAEQEAHSGYMLDFWAMMRTLFR